MHDCKCARGTVLTPKMLAATTSKRECTLQLASVHRHTRISAWLSASCALTAR